MALITHNGLLPLVETGAIRGVQKGHTGGGLTLRVWGVGEMP